MYPSEPYTLDEEIESWKGFLWALRKDDVEVWERMTRGAREYEYAIKKSGRWLTTEPSSLYSSCSTRPFGRSKERQKD